MASEEYNDLSTSLQRLQSIDIKLDEDELEILELFAQAESFTMTEITESIKNTKIQRKYKNVHNLVQKLRSSNLMRKKRMLKEPGVDITKNILS